MIYVTAGHEKSIGTEVFLKSCLAQSQKNLDKLIYVSYLKTLKENLNNLNIQFDIKHDILKLSVKKIKIKILDCKVNQTMDTLFYCLDKITSNDILFTLPSSKDQFIFKDKLYNGHTDFFRGYFNNKCIPMLFTSDQYNALLLTDHENIFHLKKFLNVNELTEKINLVLKDSLKIKKPIRRIIFSGINPHCGEDGLIGSEDKIFHDISDELKSGPMGPNVAPIGPISADAIHTLDLKPQDLVVYFYHDQGLPLFKSNSGLQGINVTCGLPFMRVSVDHGTSFHLYGKNIACTHGTDYVLNSLFRI